MFVINIFFSVELVGKHPSKTEVDTYDISKDIPAFISVKNEQIITDQYTKYLSDINKYLSNGYE